MLRIAIVMIILVMLSLMASYQPIQAATPPFSGTYMDFSEDYYLPTSKFPEYFDELTALGMDIVIVGTTKHLQGSSCSKPHSYYWYPGFPEKLWSFITEATRKNIKVWIGLVNSNSNCLYNYLYGIGAMDDDIDQMSSIVTTITQDTRFPQYTNTIAGWYITNETPADINDSGFDHYFQKAVQTIKSLTPNKPVMMSPYLATIASNPTTTAANLSRFKQLTGLDIFFMQDSVGADMQDIGWNRNTYSVSQYFSAISQAVGRNSLWLDAETFTSANLPSNFSYDGNFGVISTGFSRLKMQADAVPDSVVDKRMLFIQQFDMTDINSFHYGGNRLKSSYMAYYGLKNEYIRPTYTWISPPHANYPDHGNELFDLKMGDPKPGHYQKGWIGIIGNVVTQYDLGITKTVHSIGLHVLHFLDAAIKIPDSFTVECSLDNVVWNTVFTKNYPKTYRYDGEFVYSTDANLGIQCRYLRTTLKQNISWYFTFVTEAEIVASPYTPVNTPTSTPIPTPGDANADGRVNGIDYVIWLNNYGNSNPQGPSQGDFNSDRAVNGVDYVIWLNNYTG